MSRSTVEMLDIKKTPEIYPMTSMQETMQYFHDQLHLLKKNVFEHSAVLQRIEKQMQQLGTRADKTKASVEQAQQTVQETRAPPEAGVQPEKPEEAPYLLSTMYRRFSEQPLLPEPLWERLQANFKSAREAEPEAVRGAEQEQRATEVTRADIPEIEAELSHLDSQEDISPGVYGRLTTQYKFEEALDPEPLQELDLQAPASKCLHFRRLSEPAQELVHFRRLPEQEVEPHPAFDITRARRRALKHPSLKMMPPDDMQDILEVISSDVVSEALQSEPSTLSLS